MNQPSNTRVIRVTSLQQFTREVPSVSPADRQAIVRLVNRQTEGHHSAALMLSLQGVNADGEIVWLCEGHTVSWLHGRPFGRAAESIYACMDALATIVRAHLSSLGYDVRSGDYALPDALQPLSASFECARWVRRAVHDWQVVTAPEDEANTSGVIPRPVP